MTKNLVVITPGFASGEQDTTCIPPLQDFMVTLKQSGSIKLTILSLQYPNTTTSYDYHGIRVIPFGLNGRYVKRLIIWIRVLLKLRKLNKKERITHIHSFWLNESALIGHIFSRLYPVRHLTTLMGQDVLPTNLFARWLPLKKMTLITVSDFQKTQLNHNFGVSSEVIHWGIKRQVEFTNNMREIDVLGVGSLIKLKRFDLFIESINFLKKSFPKIKAAIVGKGIEEDFLKNMVKELNLENHVFFYGEVARPKVLELMSTAKLLLHPSEFESYGMIFTEALAQGMSIVSRKVGIAKKSMNWLIFEKDDAIVESCTALLNRVHENEHTDPIHSIHDTVESYLNYYQTN